MRFIALLCITLAALAAHAQPERPDAKRAVASVEEALKQRPADPTLWYHLARFQAELGDTRASTAALEKVFELGEGFLPARRDFGKVWGDTGFQSVRSRLEARLPRLDYAPTAFEIEDRALVPEGIAYDAPARNFYVGSIAQRKVLRVTESGAVSEFAGVAAKLDAVLGIAMDAPRRLLYVVSTSALEAASEPRRNAIVAFDVDSRRLVQRYEVAGARQLNDVAVVPGGRVFATDSAAGAVYEIAVKGPGPSRQVLAPGQLGGTNGITASADGARLFVAHSTGLAAIDIASGKLTRIANGTRENLASIDGLYAWQGQLIGVQNYTNPGRVVVITLSDDGNTATKVQTLLSHHHNVIDQPTTGAITERGFFLLAATGVGSYRNGKIVDPGSMPTPAVLRLPLPR
jgi:hypothetical protein